VGVAVAHRGVLIDGSWVWLAVPGVLLSLRRRTGWTVVTVLVLGLLLGWWRGSVYMVKLSEFQTVAGQKITIVGTATADAVYDDHKQLSFDVKNPRVEATGQHLTGKVGVSGFGTNAVFAGDEMRLTGKLKMSRGGSYQAYMSYSQMEVIAHHPTIITEVRSRFVAGLQSALPEPAASFGLGLLVGQRNTLPDEVSEMLLMVGLTHIIAVSGYNLTVLLRASKNVLGNRSKKMSTLLALALIALFLMVAGSSASIVRAAMVSVLAIAAGYFGRSVRPLLLILLAASINAYMNPYYVWTDVSWYLSFLAFFGVLILAPLLLVRFPKRLQGSVMFTIMLESLCAEIMTLPYVLHIFGQMSFIGLISNVMVVALIPLAMLLSLVAGLAGMLVPSVVGWFAWPAVMLLTYMLDVVTLLSRIPHIFVENIGFALWQLVAMYVAVAILCLSLFKRNRSKYGTIGAMQINPVTGLAESKKASDLV
jgi:competence protein ComEC